MQAYRAATTVKVTCEFADTKFATRSRRVRCAPKRRSQCGLHLEKAGNQVPGLSNVLPK